MQMCIQHKEMQAMILGEGLFEEGKASDFISLPLATQWSVLHIIINLQEFDENLGTTYEKHKKKLQWK